MRHGRWSNGNFSVALAVAMVSVFAGCQTFPGAKGPGDLEVTVGGSKARTGTPAQPGQVPEALTKQAGNAASGGTAVVGQTGTQAQSGETQNVATANPTDAVAVKGKVTGRLLDSTGKPLAGVEVNAPNGVRGYTDANGNYSLEVTPQENLRLDFSSKGVLMRQQFVSVGAGETATASPTLKALDPVIGHLSAAAGGTVTSSDGSAQLIVPPGALTSDGDVNLTWMDPLPSANFPVAYGQLPGPLVTHTMANGTQSAEDLTLPPLAFTSVTWMQTRLAPGAQATLRMRVNPDALTLAGNNIDFNNPATLQQPCYDYDRASGLWVNPATSKLEKDANGTVWFVYTLRGADQPKNLFSLLSTVTTGNYVTGQQTVTWTEQQTVWVEHPGGGGSWQTITVTKSKLVDLYGKVFGGTVTEQSSNSALNGKPLAGATVRHQTDFFGGSSKTTDSAGNYSIPMWHDTASVSVYGGNYFSGQGPGGNLDFSVNTDSHLTVTLGGKWASRNYTEPVTFVWSVDGVKKTETDLNFGPSRSYTFGRDAADDTNNWVLESAQSPTMIYVRGPSDPQITVNLRPGENKSVTIPMILNETK